VSFFLVVHAHAVEEADAAIAAAAEECRRIEASCEREEVELAAPMWLLVDHAAGQVTVQDDQRALTSAATTGPAPVALPGLGEHLPGVIELARKLAPAEQRCVLIVSPTLARRLRDGTASWARARDLDGLRLWARDEHGIVGHGAWRPDEPWDAMISDVIAWLTRQAYLSTISDRLAAIERLQAEVLRWHLDKERADLIACWRTLRHAAEALAAGELPASDELRSIQRQAMSTFEHAHARLSRAARGDERDVCVTIGRQAVQVRWMAANLYARAGLGAARAQIDAEAARSDLQRLHEQLASLSAAELNAARAARAKLGR
jgi:hypothetical protein